MNSQTIETDNFVDVPVEEKQIISRMIGTDKFVDVPVEWFTDPALRAVYVALKEQQVTTGGINPDALPSVDACRDIHCPVDMAPVLRALEESHRQRKVISLADKMKSSAENKTLPIPKLIDCFVKQLVKLKPHISAGARESVFIPNWNNQPPETAPLIELNHTNILSAGNLSMITAGAGVGKSSLLEAACASIAEGFETDTLGFKLNSKRVTMFDTERSTADTHTSWRRYMERIGLKTGDLEATPLRWLNLRGITRVEDRIDYLFSIIDLDNYPEIALIDGIGDFVNDPNNSDECVPLVSRLSAVAHNRNIGIFLTLHNNPGGQSGTKARGVLGSELWRKCQFVGMVDKLPDGVRRLTSNYNLGKNRSGSDTVATCFKWSDEHKRHVTCDAPAPEEKPGKIAIQNAAIIKKMGCNVFSCEGLTDIIKNEAGIKERAAINRINELCNKECIKKLDDGTYQAVLPEAES